MSPDASSTTAPDPNLDIAASFRAVDCRQFYSEQKHDH